MKGRGGATETKRGGVDDDNKVLKWGNSRPGKKGKGKDTGLKYGRGRVNPSGACGKFDFGWRTPGVPNSLLNTIFFGTLRERFGQGKVCGFMRLWVEDNFLNHICEETRVQTMWNKLESLCAPKTVIKFEDEICGLWVLGTLPDSWEIFRTSLSNSAPNGILSMDLVKSSVLNEEMRRKSQSSSVQSDFLVTERRGRSKSKGPRVNLVIQQSSWVIDSGASVHATSKREFFASYTPGDFGSVRMGNDGPTNVVGIGDVHLKNRNGSRLILKNVKHIPDIHMNLISTGKLDDEGFCNTFDNGIWKLTKGSMVIASGQKFSSLYYMDAKIIDYDINTVNDEANVELWHKRLSHMSEKGLKILTKKNHLHDLKSTPLKRCPHCLAGKQTRVTFKSSQHSRKSNVLELVHSNVCGLMKTKSLGGALYFVTFTDDHSRKIWVYTLKTKDQVFKQFHASVERETGEKLKCIRTDNGGEYCGPFDEYCRNHGIRHQKTPPKSSQLNGIAKRLNRTLVERVRCLLTESQLPQSFWGEALNTVIHVLNLTPCVPLGSEVPNRIWSGKDISYSHLRVFGCKAFVHVPKDERSKLDAKTKPCVFLGYGQDEFGYRVYHRVKKKLIRSRDVVFVEDQTIADIEKIDEPKSKHKPESYEEAIEDEHKREWNDAMKDEMKSLHANHTFELVKLSKGKTALRNKWVYRIKQEEHTSKPRYKARLVVKGFNQKKDIDFDEIFAPVVKMSSIRVVLGLAASLDLEVEQMDVKTAFLHGDLDKEIYMEQPVDFEQKGKEHLMNVSRIDSLKKQLSKSFAMKDLGPTKKVLGIQIVRDRASKKLYMSQEPDIAHAVGVVSRFMSNPGKQHWEAVKCIMRYLRGTSRLKLTFGDGKPVLIGYTDSDMAGEIDSRKSTSSYLMTFADGAVSWQSRLQKCVTLSTTEAEYIAAAEAYKEMLWMKRFIQELGFKQQRYVI
ncbi:Retrovirus-related Pol polyprotein from transposon TNT 1-94 [Cucumis melo var. makuwa]|uniref:Retrovirus-related Pol polyprotein from transposon TNT 1-94 n=2 Tax=Cucumis melo TaxID=3656 RepID=A0A5A7TFU1_CUCMM|nr:Retrovirus-related Pol polyprotein from transposon TNT 1-94 [Cucumis melo var. makuwa]